MKIELLLIFIFLFQYLIIFLYKFEKYRLYNVIFILARTIQLCFLAFVYFQSDLSIANSFYFTLPELDSIFWFTIAITFLVDSLLMLKLQNSNPKVFISLYLNLLVISLFASSVEVVMFLEIVLISFAILVSLNDVCFRDKLFGHFFLSIVSLPLFWLVNEPIKKLEDIGTLGFKDALFDLLVYGAIDLKILYFLLLLFVYYKVLFLNYFVFLIYQKTTNSLKKNALLFLGLPILFIFARNYDEFVFVSKGEIQFMPHFHLILYFVSFLWILLKLLNERSFINKFVITSLLSSSYLFFFIAENSSAEIFILMALFAISFVILSLFIGNRFSNFSFVSFLFFMIYLFTPLIFIKKINFDFNYSIGFLQETYLTGFLSIVWICFFYFLYTNYLMLMKANSKNIKI